jgi:DNA-binding GntR family transcriptional regulator
MNSLSNGVGPKNGLSNYSLAHQVMKQLRTEIIQGQLPPGTRLIEMQIARRMGTSQGPVREAMRMLEHVGLVERRAHTATFVSPIVPHEIYGLFKIRAAIESYAIRRAIKHITNTECDELDELITAMHKSGLQNDITTLFENDLLFHRLICEWSKSHVIIQAWMPLYFQIQRFIIYNHPNFFTNLTDIADTHKPIVQALRQGKPANAAHIIRTHIMLVWLNRKETSNRTYQPDTSLVSRQFKT